MELKEILEKLSPEQREKAREITNADELIAFAKEEGYDLTDDQLEAVAGGAWELPTCDHVIRS